MNILDSEKLLHNILNTLESKGLTEKDLLKNAQLGSSYFSDWKAGKNKTPSLDKIYRIATALNVSVDALIQNTFDSCSSDDLSIDEVTIIKLYRELDRLGKIHFQDAIREIWAVHRTTDKGKSSTSFQDNIAR